MIQKIDASIASLKTDVEGNQELVFAVDGASRFRAKALYQEVKQRVEDGKAALLTLSMAWYKNKRSLDQNALMWALLTEYALALGGGRTGDTTPEELYHKAVVKYGPWTYAQVPIEGEHIIMRSAKIVKRIDVYFSNGIECGTYKCWLGSSEYDTKEMTNLIDGILDDMAKEGIYTPQMQYLQDERIKQDDVI